MAQWFLRQKSADYHKIGEKHHIDPLIAMLLRNRDVSSDQEIEQYLYGTRESFHDPMLMKDMDAACEILARKIREGKKLRVIGDYDADGVCACAILLKGLRFMGAEADAVIPHRMKDGYGLNEELIGNASESGVDTIVTCDNGIAAKTEIAYANALGMTVIVTDHHEVPFEETAEGRKQILPPAEAVVDPKREDCGYPFSGICGAFVAYKLISAMADGTYIADLSAKKGWDRLEKELLQLAALATITDVMELKDENRVLVKLGLELLADTSSDGLKALLRVNGIYGTPVSVYHLGFILGPCINATGRIDTASRALELMMAESGTEAMVIAEELKEMNERRKLITEQAVTSAVRQIEEGMHEGMPIYVIYLPECHESVAGIVAGRIRERYYRPTLVITDAEEGLKGSGRSIEGYDMYRELTKVSDIFTKYGGHAQAAGFSLPKENLEELRVRLNQNSGLTEKDFNDKLYIDAQMPFSYVKPELMEQLELLEPYGNGNPRPVFSRRDVALFGAKTFGAEGRVARYSVRDTDGHRAELTVFHDKNLELKAFLTKQYGEEEVRKLFRNESGGLKLSVAYYIKWNEYRGRKEIQFILEDFCLS